MRLLDRIRTAHDPVQIENHVQYAFRDDGRVRHPIYRNDERIGDVFQQQLPNVRQLTSGAGVGIELSGGIASFVGIKVGETQTVGRSIEITPLLQVLLLEEVARERGQLVDLATSAAKADGLLTFVGPARLFRPWEAADVEALEQRRQAHEEIVGHGKADDPGTIVWVAQGATPLACIASWKYVQAHNLARLPQNPSFGVLGHLEETLERFALLTPLVIWRL